MKCRNCNGQGSFIVGIGNNMSLNKEKKDNNPMEAVKKDCYFCEGKGKLTKKELKAKNERINYKV